MPHTPGPWTLSASPKTIYIAYDNGHFKTYVAEVSLQAYKPDAKEALSTCQADARLVAAAPELLAALKELTAQLDLATQQLDIEAALCASELYAARAVADSAIAKAEGR